MILTKMYQLRVEVQLYKIIQGESSWIILSGTFITHDTLHFTLLPRIISKLAIVRYKLQNKFHNNLEMVILPIMVLCSVDGVTVVAEKGFS